MDSEDDDDLYLSDGPVSRSGLADGTRSGSDPEDDNASGSGPGTGLGCGVVSVVSVLFSSSLFFMMLYSIYTLHDRSRQSTKTCAECHTYSLVWLWR